MENGNLAKPQALPPQSSLLDQGWQRVYSKIWRGVSAALTGVSVFYFEHRAGAMCTDRLQVGFRPPQAQPGPGVTMATSGLRRACGLCASFWALPCLAKV